MIYELSPRASAQIDEIIRYTDAYFGPRQTEDYLSGLYTSFDVLVDNPRLGRPWGDAGTGNKRRYIYRSH